MADWALTVQELNEYVRKRLAGDPMLRGVRVRGEISGYRPHFSGHRYFILKDEGSRINCVLFRQNAHGLDREIQNGDQVTVTGQVSLFVRDGAYQFYVDEIEHQGAGALHLRFEQLKKRLMAEGLFDPAVKKPLPEYPRTIGIVTSETGAAVRDMIRVAKQRNPRVGILLRPAQVQGPGAAQDIADAIAELNDNGRADVLLVGRGGGSMEELWAFNEEIVARAIYNSRIPVISCVGHEVDTTIADFVADVRAATPSQAAEIAVPVLDEIEERLEMLRRRADGLMSGRLQLCRSRLNAVGAGYVLSNPQKALIGERRQRLATVAASYVLREPRKALVQDRRQDLQRLAQANALVNPRKTLIPQRRLALQHAMSLLAAQNPRQSAIRSGRDRLQELYGRMRSVHRMEMNQRQMALEIQHEKVLAMNPANVLSRGYAAVYCDGKIVETIRDLKPKTSVRVRLSDGQFAANITAVMPDEEQ